MRFPTYQDLSEEQDEINNLPLKGNYLVTGPPGTGKTVMALYRGQMISERGESVRLLMHGKLLSQYTSQVVEDLGMDGAVTTFHSWINKWCWATWRCKLPQVAPYQPDWTKIIDLAIERRPEQDAMPNLLVDEGQDMRPEFFMFARSIARGLTVFADENQRITEQNSTLEEIREKVRPELELELTRNYRNTVEIATVAARFHQGTDDDLPELPTDRKGRKPSLNAHPRTHESAQQIANYATNFKRQQIGVLVPNKKIQTTYLNRLAAALPPDVPLQHYVSGGKGPAVDFTKPGVTVVNWASAKGLEFDAVFLPELQAVTRALDDPTLLMELYVLCSRARERLFLSYAGEGIPAIVSILPLLDMEVVG